MAKVQALSELNRLVKRDDHKSVLVLCNKLLASTALAEDPVIQETKIVAALNAHLYQDAVDTAASKPRFAFLKAYAQYRINDLDGCLQSLEVHRGRSGSEAEESEPARHLRAQVFYRQGRYTECCPLYEQILTELHAEEAEMQDIWDAELNLAASYVSSGQSLQVLASPSLTKSVAVVLGNQVMEEDLPYELVYNIACALIDNGNAALAARALEQALNVGARFLSGEQEEGSASVLHDLASVRVQAALLLQGAHYDEAAQAIYAQISGAGKGKHHGSGATDPATLAVAANNRAHLSSWNGTSRSVIDSLKKVVHALSSAETSKLTRRQIITLQLNRALLLLQQRKLDESAVVLAEARAGVKSLSTTAGSSTVHTALSQHADVIDAALRHQRAILTSGASAAWTSTQEHLRTLVAERSSSSTAVVISPLTAAYAQTLVSEGNFSEAAKVLLSSSSNPVHPATAAAAAQLLWMDSKSPVDAALKPLQDCSDGWVKAANATASSSSSPATLQQALAFAAQALTVRAGFLTNQGKFDDAASSYEALRGLPSISSEVSAATFACLATLRMQQASVASRKGSADLRTRCSKEADVFLQQASRAGASSSSSSGSNSSNSNASAATATGSDSPSRGRRGSRAGIAEYGDEILESLEWSNPDQQQRKTLAAGNAALSSSSTTTTTPSSPKRSASVGPSVPGTPPPSAAALVTSASSAAEEAAKLAAKVEAAKARERRRRAKRREKYLTALRESGRYGTTGANGGQVALPPPQPDRWIAKRDRLKKKAKASKAYATGSGHQGGVDKRVENQLDARARAEAEKDVLAKKGGGSGGTAVGAGSGSTPAVPAGVAAAIAAGAKKKKGKK